MKDNRDIEIIKTQIEVMRFGLELVKETRPLMAEETYKKHLDDMWSELGDLLKRAYELY